MDEDEGKVLPASMSNILPQEILILLRLCLSIFKLKVDDWLRVTGWDLGHI